MLKVQKDQVDLAVVETAALAEKTASADFEQLASQHLKREPAQQAETVGKQLEQSADLAALGRLVGTAMENFTHNGFNKFLSEDENGHKHEKRGGITCEDKGEP